MGRIWSIVIAGEAIFVLPFLIPRLFRPTLLTAWGLTNSDFGLAFTCYGLTAMIAYGLGGPLADRFSPRWLMTAALLLTAVGGLTLWNGPTPLTLCALYGFFGVTTILLFWAAMIRATHDVGGTGGQGLAFGLLDGGRGLFAAILASGLVMLLGEGDASIGLTEMQRDESVRMILSVAIGVVVIAAVAVCWALPSRPNPIDQRSTSRDPAKSRDPANWWRVLALPRLWIHGLVVLIAYCGYKSIDNYGIFVVDAFGWNERDAAKLTSAVFWIRPIAAVAMGALADRIGRFVSLGILFLLMGIGNAAMALLACGMAQGEVTMVASTITMVLLSTSAAVFGLRAVYFAVMDDLQIAPGLLGAAAGVISMVGFLPDVFFGTVTGWVIDTHPGWSGHTMVFIGVGVASLLGMTISIWQSRTLALSPVGAENQTDSPERFTDVADE